jgi:hypothetical protein
LAFSSFNFWYWGNEQKECQRKFSAARRVLAEGYFADGSDETREKNRKRKKRVVEKRRRDLEQKDLNGGEGIAVYY